MGTSLLIPAAVGIVFALAAIACAIIARELPLAVRIIAALVFVPFALFSLFGFMASFEPLPNAWIWRIAYVVLFLVSLLAIIRLLFIRRS